MSALTSTLLLPPPSRRPPSPPRICTAVPICHTIIPQYACAHRDPVRRYCAAALQLSDPPTLCGVPKVQTIPLPNRKCPTCVAKARAQRQRAREVAKAEKARCEEEEQAERLRRVEEDKKKRD
ncbi:uncharacterized protein BDZ99DRAFT_519470 [Mytilinidion resinicola]|uniref:Uncharacterized protein n=1 Tax=Mytilinidion resinicola TaxID=574789 RepID=A0A6A6YQI5_9PEZI|nr:uncharacterized protein BDZ99DRAFT_519470 [Mytilinidion resinicola]KAF2810793.1 hypothetical protein BDZ99DRAFT_519470 [Mytilinidion resinicola]